MRCPGFSPTSPIVCRIFRIVNLKADAGCEPLVGRFPMNDGCQKEQTLESNRARYSYLKT
ncbi:hypothetical protein XAC3810_430024 [Xanthomonas citri pv. citri]|uniref:Uncharacterized protein n=1 Tax=Xanthomonas citri pv. citri TaxID=611301 RepID=A0A0U5FHG7_XANCI|nr:hypothetical protein XAC9322_430047 [Xanthomonas citri pv. citri]CEE28598.1 hypothetical protein XAC1083_430049 [Xanthomonas citri pv. citri]CEE37719.1 hypothetical protein XAC3810_430024 [Xanthomonas citri pv. citri]CEE40608.1 hypothetical protein XAC2911_410008 [Xanthomonas citri pv. citri]CEE43540.1 hypothetical protein XAC908_590048 [Xanthomonas citri pv. citri]